LRKYLGFRHFSRHAYAFDLEWQLMKDLVARIQEVEERTLDEIKSFISKIKEGNESIKLPRKRLTKGCLLF
jgi:hypothetical protein